jgi:hypothetical protein
MPRESTVAPPHPALADPRLQLAPDLCERVQKLLVDGFLSDQITVGEYRLLMEVYRSE